MVDPNEELAYAERFVAFLDILGFRELVLSDRQRCLSHIGTLDERLRHVLETVRTEHEEGFFSTRMFSDCICLATGYSAYELAWLLSELSFIQLDLAWGGIFIRGGLSCGPHFENDLMVFSEGLVRAYDLEREAVYPRVVIDDSVTSFIRDRADEVSKYIYFPGEEIGLSVWTHPRDDCIAYISRSSDGYYFVDYLDVLRSSVMEPADGFDEHKKALLLQVAKNPGNRRILSKYHWLAEYHNRKFAQLFLPEDWHEPYYSGLRDRCLIDITETFP